ncbi:MAG: helix-turn-helix domain-containing protein [Hellea sp.]
MSAQKYIRTCSIWRALEVVGDKPTLLLLESYWLGTRRFSVFQKQTGLLKTVVSDRLAKLISSGCFEKSLYSDRPKRYEYRGTEKFYDLYPAALSMLHWENKWGENDGKIQLSLRHKSCGKETNPHAVCQNCRAEIDPRDVAWSEGPGVGLMPAEYSRRRRKTGPAKQGATPLLDEIADIIGDRWSALIIRSIFTNLNSYQDICDDTGIATNILAERLERLCEKSILEKRGSVYKLQPKGHDIYPILIALMQWGDKWYASPKGPPLILKHEHCGAPLESQMACSECGETVTMRDIAFEVVTEEAKAKS